MGRLLALRQQRAFERLYRRHVADVYRYALAVLRDPDDAEQITQTTFLNAYRSVGGHGLDLNRLLTIAHDLCRRRTARAWRADAAFDGDPTADDVRRGLARLPFDERAVLVMREVEDRSYSEIAELLGVPPGDIEELILRARRSLRQEIDGPLSCPEAQLAVSRELDDRSSRRERRLLRAHLHRCIACWVFSRDQQGQRAALRQLAQIELPRSLESFQAGAQDSSASGISQVAAAGRVHLSPPAPPEDAGGAAMPGPVTCGP
jgi:RNA polymerase sigma-70 factor (ECF subfamily)